MKLWRVGATAGLLLMLAACSNVKSKPVPSDPAKWDTLADDVKQLGDEDRRLFTAYLMRTGIGAAVDGSKTIVPPGVTIGSAIDEQKKFEADQKLAESQAAALKAKSDAERAVAVKQLAGAVTVVMTGLSVLPKNYDVGRYNERLSFVYAVQNHTGKAITGIKGTVVFRDQFGALIQRMGLSLDEDVAPNGMRTISGYGKDINEFENSDTRLAVTPMAKLKITFEPEMIVFSDGTNLAAPADGSL